MRRRRGEPAEVALAIEEHYKPRFAGDTLPASKTGQALALADKIDTLVGIFAIQQRPTGTKDPFGLRRAALGVLRILLEGRLDVDLIDLLRRAAAAQPVQRTEVVEEVYDFIADRLRGLLLERADGTTAEMIDAVLAGRPRSPLDVETRLQALKVFLLLPDAGVLTGINKRIVNILRKAAPGAHPPVQAAALTEEAELALHRVLNGLSGTVEQAIAERRYADALHSLTGLRAAVDEFFERIMVMDENLERRNNRLAAAAQCSSTARRRSGLVAIARLTLHANVSIVVVHYLHDAFGLRGRRAHGDVFLAAVPPSIRHGPRLGARPVLGVGTPLRTEIRRRGA